MKAIRAVKTPKAAQAFDPLRFCAPTVDPDQRRALVAEAAYFRAEKRNFAPGFEEEDWLAAEAEITHLLSSGKGAVGNGN